MTMLLSTLIGILLVVLGTLITLLLRIKRRAEEAELDKSHLQALIDSLPDLTWVKDLEGRFLMVNRQFSKAFELPKEAILGKTDHDLADAELADSYLRDDKWVIEHRRALVQEERVVGEGGREAWAETVKVPTFDSHDRVVGTAGMARDITERKRAEQSLSHLAHHDALTGLPNRTLLTSKVNDAILKHEEEGDHLLLMLVDLDNFKIINDNISHAVGDVILIELADRLGQLDADNYFVSRIGGDEFVLVFPHTAPDASEALARKIQSAVKQPIRHQGMSFEITMSMGIASYPENGRDCWALVQNADLAMTHAKHLGKNAVSLFTESLAQKSAYRMSLDGRMKKALANNEFVLFYQPKVSVSDGAIVGAEALMRWQEEDTGNWVSPGEFIPAAEQSGFILELGDWAIDQALRQLAAWRDMGLPLLPIAVNVSAVQVHQNRIVEQIQKGLAHYQLQPGLIELELTESLVMENSETIIATLEVLREQGVALSIDDFGTGYSSLAYLTRFPLNKLKIDKSFVKDIDRRKENQQISRALVELARGLELTVVAEGVETLAELNMLAQLKVPECQGFLFDPALPAQKLGEKLAASHRYLPDDS